MRDEERIARELQARLGDDARVVGEGVHWSVELERGRRACKVSCFWYGDLTGLVLGMTPGNTRAALGPDVAQALAQRRGAEYLVRFHDDGRRIAGGRTQDIDAAIGAMREWLEGSALADVERSWPFVDATRRRMRALLAIIEPTCGTVARCALEIDTRYELWAYGDGRSCRLYPGDGVVTASFWIGHAQVAFGDITGDPARAVSRWVHGAPLSELQSLGVTAERHAEVLEAGDAARWHWLHVRDRIRDPGDVLAGSRAVIERLAERELPTRFFSYSSLDRFCFSASSHYPWVDHDLPVIGAADRGEANLDRTIERVETALAACPITPFFGSATRLVVDKLDTALAAAGSTLSAKLRQRGQWFDAAVALDDRVCRVADDLRAATFRDASDASAYVVFERPADTVRAIRCWLEDRASRDQLGTLAGVTKASIDEARFDPD